MAIKAFAYWLTVFWMVGISGGISAADSPDTARLLVGQWVINDELSDNTDDQVEVAIKAAGGKVRRRWFSKREEDFYRGGPAEQELYDRISYDDALRISIKGVECTFEYEDSYVRLFHSDGRRRQSSANSFYREGGEDFSLAHWEGEKLIVEARPRDGGFALETYSVSADGTQLTVDMQIEPDNFGAAINLVRVFNRRAD